MKKLISIWIFALLLMASPIYADISDSQKRNISQKLIFHAANSYNISAENVTGTVNGVSFGVPVYDSPNQATHYTNDAMDYTTSKTYATLNFTACIYTNATSNGDTFDKYFSKNEQDIGTTGEWEINLDDRAGSPCGAADCLSFFVRTASSSQVIARTSIPDLNSNTSYKTICGVFNQTSGNTYAYLYYNTMPAASATDTQVSTERTDIVTVMDRGTHDGFAGTGGVKAAIIINFSLKGDEIAYVNAQFQSGNYNLTFVSAISDILPPQITDINLTSEINPQIVNLTDKFCEGIGCIIPSTNDTTPTFRAVTDENAFCAVQNHNIDQNYTDLTTTYGLVNCTTTGTTSHICTLPTLNLTDTGVKNFSIGCKDTTGNENRTSTSGKFTINITERTNVSLNILLNGKNMDREYEYPLRDILDNGTEIINYTIVNITINISQPIRNCIYIEDENITCDIGSYSYYFNISRLIDNKFLNNDFKINITDGRKNISIQHNNNTDLVYFKINLTGSDNTSGFPKNIELDFNKNDDFDIKLPGLLKGKRIEKYDFLINGINYSSINNTLTSGGSISLLLNMTNGINIFNFSMLLSGYDIDNNNEFTYTEHFNNTDNLAINSSLSINTSYPLWVFDDFTVNDSRWALSSNNGCTMTRGITDSDNVLVFACNDGEKSSNLDYTDISADFRNTSLIEANVHVTKSFSQSYTTEISNLYFYATDGINNILLYTESAVGCCSTDALFNYNFTLKSQSSDYKSWQVLKNGTDLGTKSLSPLDFTQQIKLRWRIVTGPSTAPSLTWTLKEIKWGGAGLPRNTNNGTYWYNGNVTQCVIATTNNISRMVLNCFENKPSGTTIAYYLSNTGNNITPVFESITLGTSHIFTTQGNRPCWRAKLNSSINTSTPVIKKCILQVVKGSLQNISVDIGNDGDIDWNFEGVLNSTTSPKNVNITTTNEFINYKDENCINSKLCQYPITISSDSSGILSITDLNITTNNIQLMINKSFIENYDFINITSNFINGILEYNGLVIDFKGSKNYTIVGIIDNTSYTYRNDSKKAIFKYSKFNCTFPIGITSYQILPMSNNQTNISVLGQEINYCNVSVDTKCVHTSIPIFNCTNLAYDDSIGLTLKSNISIHNDFNFSFDYGVNRTTAKRINSTIEINMTEDLAIGQSKPFFSFVDFYNVSISSLNNLDFNLIWRAYCSGCVR